MNKWCIIFCVLLFSGCVRKITSSTPIKTISFDINREALEKQARYVVLKPVGYGDDTIEPVIICENDENGQKVKNSQASNFGGRVNLLPTSKYNKFFNCIIANISKLNLDEFIERNSSKNTTLYYGIEVKEAGDTNTLYVAYKRDYNAIVLSCL